MDNPAAYFAIISHSIFQQQDHAQAVAGRRPGAAAVTQAILALLRGRQVPHEPEPARPCKTGCKQPRYAGPAIGRGRRFPCQVKGAVAGHQGLGAAVDVMVEAVNLCAHPGKLTQILRRAVKKKTASMSVSDVNIYYGKRCFVILVFSPWKAQDFSAALVMQQPALSLH